MSEWRSMETAPKDGTAFLVTNWDREVWVAKFFAEKSGPRLTYRLQYRYEPKHFIVHEIQGKRLLEDVTTEKPEWQSSWMYWSEGLEFAPTHWMPLPEPPQ